MRQFAFEHFECATYVTENKAVSLFYSAKVKEVSKDFVILWSMLRLSLSCSMPLKASKSLIKS